MFLSKRKPRIELDRTICKNGQALTGAVCSARLRPKPTSLRLEGPLPIHGALAAYQSSQQPEVGSKALYLCFPKQKKRWVWAGFCNSQIFIKARCKRPTHPSEFLRRTNTGPNTAQAAQPSPFTQGGTPTTALAVFQTPRTAEASKPLAELSARRNQNPATIWPYTEFLD